MNKTDIVNSALNLLNGREVISITEQTDEARIARRYYDLAVKSVLTMEKWLCSVGFIRLTRLNNKVDTGIFGFKYTYLVPADVTNIIRVYNANEPAVHKQDYLQSGVKIYSNSDDLSIECSMIISPEFFTAGMTECVILKLASLMAPVETDVASGLRGKYMQEIEDIVSYSVNEIDTSLDNFEDNVIVSLVR